MGLLRGGECNSYWWETKNEDGIPIPDNGTINVNYDLQSDYKFSEAPALEKHLETGIRGSCTKNRLRKHDPSTDIEAVGGIDLSIKVNSLIAILLVLLVSSFFCIDEISCARGQAVTQKESIQNTILNGNCFKEVFNLSREEVISRFGEIYEEGTTESKNRT